ncbi:hypothetical protein [Halohasta litorea]|uniref:Uncharacterized protein n=1 Tax=Halohasta litorea TaxID=869891 RepID=A0ABD6D6B8_9EURY|nr:hypothetical protein [Halohasta litorea]
MEQTDLDFERIDKVGTAQFFISEDDQYFKKRVAGETEILTKEFKNLQRANDIPTIDGLEFIRPVDVSDQYLITEYVDAESLLDFLSPEAYEQFGSRLRKLHQHGHTHSELQFNDVLYDGETFYLTDLGYLDEREPIHDLVSPKVGIEVFKIKQPWRWRLFDRCFDRFLEGYGHENVDGDHFDEFYNWYFQKRIDSYKDRDVLSWRFYLLSVLRKTGAIK